MRALKQARKLIEKKPESQAAQALSTLVVALESETPFALQSLYQLDYDDFELALDVLKEWRLDRYYSSKVRLLDLSVQLGEMRQASQAPAVAVPDKATPAAATTAKA
jgi:flagellar biosynthesis/type III secretory pathway protein FliH